MSASHILLVAALCVTTAFFGYVAGRRHRRDEFAIDRAVEMLVERMAQIELAEARDRLARDSRIISTAEAARRDFEGGTR